MGQYEGMNQDASYL